MPAKKPVAGLLLVTYVKGEFTADDDFLEADCDLRRFALWCAVGIPVRGQGVNWL